MGEQPHEGDLQRRARQDQREQREDVLEAARAVRVEGRIDAEGRLDGRRVVEEALVVPELPVDARLAQDRREDGRAVERQGRVAAVQAGQGAGRVEADLEALVGERGEQAVARARRRAGGEDPGDPPPDREVLVGVEQAVDQLAGDRRRRLGQPAGGPRRDVVPGQQRNHLRGDHRTEVAQSP